ncbi:MAG: peptidase m56, blar1 domain protein [Parcubacteria group bacterium]|nr:peptidase m56, blar1 domain protein [Parcubacteria group bacterium]
MRKRDFYAAVGLLVLIFLLVAFRPWHRASHTSGANALYASDVYKAAFQFPKNWKEAPGYAGDRFEGEDGFFEVSAVGTDGAFSLSDVVSLEEGDTLFPYGTSPKVATIAAGGKPGALIVPSANQGPSMRGQAALVVAYPEPVEIEGAKYFYFVLMADKDHIRALASSLEFRE